MGYLTCAKFSVSSDERARGRIGFQPTRKNRILRICEITIAPFITGEGVSYISLRRHDNPIVQE